MSSYPHPIIAREGWPFIALSVAASLLVTFFCGGWSWPFWLVTVFVVQFFRDPARPIPADADAILSPADGRIVVVAPATDPYRHVPALKISVFMNVFNVHSNRSPADGRVEEVAYFKGSFVNADLDKASEQNERNAVLLRTTGGRDITFVQIAGLVARRILCYVRAGDHLRRGQRYGFIRFGSRVDVYLPTDAVPLVTIGDKVSASSTVLARLPLAGDAAVPQAAENVETAAVVEAAATAAAGDALTAAEADDTVVGSAAAQVEAAVRHVARNG